MSREVGKIENNQVCFMNINLVCDFENEKFDVDVEFDERVIRDMKKINKAVVKLVKNIEKIMQKDNECTNKEFQNLIEKIRKNGVNHE